MRGINCAEVLHRVGELPIGSKARSEIARSGMGLRISPTLLLGSDGDVSFGHAVIGVEGHAQGIRVFGRRIILIA